MKKIMPCLVLLSALLAVEAAAQSATIQQGTSPLSFSVTPGVSIPVGADASFFTMGAGVDISGEYAFPFLPFLFARGDLGYTYAPAQRLTSMSVMDLSGGVGAKWEIVPSLVLKAYARAGYFYGFVNDGSGRSGGSGLAAANLGLSYRLLPGLALGVEGSYRMFFGLLNDVTVTLAAAYTFGASGPSSRPGTEINQPAAKPQPLQQAVPAAATAGVDGLVLANIALADVFPVFYKYYDDHPVGTAVVRNTGSASIQNVMVSVFVKQYMDNPKQVKALDALQAGEEKPVDLFGLFTTDVLGINAPTKVSTNITVAYTMNGKSYTRDYVETMRIQKANAMTWDDDRKAAAFITSSDPTIMKLAKNIAAAVNEKSNAAIDRTLQTAIAMHEALHLFGIAYVSDPTSPLQTKDRQTIDAIQFPLQTLDFKSGDCDDLSVLYASMFETVGLETALLTTPGHILMAVALGIPPDAARSTFARPDDLIFNGDKVWLPIETTLRDSDLLAAWASGAKLWREATARKQANFYSVHEAWGKYESVGLSGAALGITPPDMNKLVSVFSAEVEKFVSAEIAGQEAVLLSNVSKTKSGSKAVNSLGVLYSRYGLLDKAQKQFAAVLAKEEYVPSLINLGNLYFMKQDITKALEYYGRAYTKSPKNPTVLLCVARANHEIENYATAKKAYADLKGINPELAQQFSYLDLRGEEAARAADLSQVKGVVVWEE
jgi:tetratricopeptide (TPR) repeat protein